MKVIRKIASTQYKELRQADLVIDERDVVIKDRYGLAPRPATPVDLELLEES
jgi:hypothetical protein